MPVRRLAPILLGPLLLLIAVVAPAAPSAEAAPSQQIRLEGPIAEGVYLRERSDPGPVTSVSVEVQPDAPVRFEPVLSSNRIDGGQEHVSSMCDRAGGVVCVNTSFATCPSCGQPFGGIVQGGVLLRSPTPFQDQMSVVNGRLTLDPWMWSAGLWAREGGEPVEFHGVNVGMNPGGTYLYTRAYGDSTGAPPGSYELVVRAPNPLWTGVGVRQPVEFIRVNTEGDTTIPPDGAVISAYGSSTHALWEFVEANHTSHVELITNTPGGLEQSFAGHPVLLHNGERRQLDPADGKVSGRHPRTLVGWNDDGTVWIVVVDGRQSHSRGMTLPEATDHLVSLGAQHAVNFDGGGSSTMVTTCPSETGWCLRNRPSDGRERHVWVALALIPESPPPPPPTTTTPPPSSTVPPNHGDAEGGPDQVSDDDPVLWTEAPTAASVEETKQETKAAVASPPPTTTTSTTSTTSVPATTTPPPTTTPPEEPVATVNSVVPAGEEAIGAGGLEDRSGRDVPAATLGLAVLLVVGEVAMVAWLLRRRKLRHRLRSLI